MTDKKKSSSNDTQTGGSKGPKVTPTGDMLTAHILAMLHGWSAYGYELAQRLEESGLGTYNKGSIYRLLRQMEESGLVSSNWDTSKDGPARRVYDLTDVGRLFLDNWMNMVKLHQSFVLDLMEMNPLFRRRDSKSTNQKTGNDADSPDNAGNQSAEKTTRKKPGNRK